MKMDLNSDLGESLGAWRMGDDAAMLGIVSSANVACGFHAGDPAGVLATLRHAQKNGVAVGAHPGFPDLVGFGRRDMSPSPDELRTDVMYQIGALKAFCEAVSVPHAAGRVAAAGSAGSRSLIFSAAAAGIFAGSTPWTTTTAVPFCRDSAVASSSCRVRS